MKVERIPGYAKAVLESYGVGKTSGEVLLIINAYGINSMTIDCALEAKRLGVTSIAITSSSSRSVPKEHPSRHPTGKNLYQTVDIYLNNHLALWRRYFESRRMSRILVPHPPSATAL